MNDPHLDPHHDARLSELISDSVSDVEPSEGLSAIRSRTRKETSMSSNRNWLYAVGGAIAGVAAVIGVVAVVTQLGDDDSSTPTASSSSPSEPDTNVGGSSAPADSSSPAETASDTPTSSESTPTSIEGAVPVYYAGDGPTGTVLYREFQPGIGGDPVAQAAYAAVAGPPRDPDYRSLWPAGTEATASYAGDVITVDLTGASLHDLPQGMSKKDASLALQQVVYSVQGAAQQRAGVQLLLDGKHTDTVLGQPSSEPITDAPIGKVLSQMSITMPEEGQTVSGKLKASGVNNGFEATVAFEIRDADGQSVMGGGQLADGCCEINKLFPWEFTVDLSDIAPGTYTFVAMNDDPSGGEGHGPATDTRTIIIE